MTATRYTLPDDVVRELVESEDGNIVRADEHLGIVKGLEETIAEAKKREAALRADLTMAREELGERSTELAGVERDRAKAEERVARLEANLGQIRRQCEAAMPTDSTTTKRDLQAKIAELGHAAAKL